MAKLRYLKNVITLELDIEKCIGCGRCAEVCPHTVFEIENKKAKIIDYDACMECGACQLNCPTQAIKVKAGVGCVAAVIKGFLTRSEPTCDCSNNNSSCCS
ncbi:MAG: 4Fe-4S binding protein [Planctomycetes bacterium]|nr:4Fe-4S binding protein [Planctomycetota bacterium]